MSNDTLLRVSIVSSALLLLSTLALLAEVGKCKSAKDTLASVNAACENGGYLWDSTYTHKYRCVYVGPITAEELSKD
jgi:hypothetical protein